VPAGGDDDEALDRRVRAALDAAVAAYAPQIAEATARYRAATGALLAALNEASASDRCVVKRRMSRVLCMNLSGIHSHRFLGPHPPYFTQPFTLAPSLQRLGRLAVPHAPPGL
jgi:hypothetical protein